MNQEFDDLEASISKAEDVQRQRPTAQSPTHPYSRLHSPSILADEASAKLYWSPFESWDGAGAVYSDAILSATMPNLSMIVYGCPKEVNV